MKYFKASSATTVPRIKRQTTIYKPVRVKSQTGYKYVTRPVLTWVSVPDNRMFFVRKASELYRSLSKSLKIIAIAPILLFSFNFMWQKLRPFYGSLYSIQSVKLSLFQNNNKHGYSIADTLSSQFNSEKQIQHFSDYWHIKNPPASGRVVAQNYLTDMIISLFRNKSIERQGLNFLERLFKQDQTHQAGLFLLKNVLKDPEFVDQSKIFGKDLVAHVVQTKQCKIKFKQLVLDVLRQDQVKKQSVEIIKYLVNQQKTKQLMATFFKGVFLRDDIKDSLNNLFTKAAFVTLQQQINQERFGEFILKVVGEKKVQEGIYTSMMKPVKSRVYSTLTLGLYNGESSSSSSSSSSSNVNKKSGQIKHTLSKDIKLQSK